MVVYDPTTIRQLERDQRERHFLLQHHVPRRRLFRRRPREGA